MRKIKNAILNTLAALLPQQVARIRAIRNREISQQTLAREGAIQLTEKLFQHLGNRVLAGPFKNITLTPLTHADNPGPFLLGIYESELFPLWQRLSHSTWQPDLCLDIGARFGFYAVALKKLFPQAKVIAFDPDPLAQEATMEMAKVNQVEIHLESLCTPEWLSTHLAHAPRTLILSDCEGYEATLFSKYSPNLQNALLIIELHPHLVPDVEQRITSAFHKTHRVEKIPLDDAPPSIPLDFLPESERKLLMASWRSPEQSFLYLTPREIQL